MNNPIVSSLLVALVVVGGVLAGGYFGLDKIKGALGPQNGGEAVIIELKEAAVTEIRAVRSETITEIRQMKDDINASLEKVSGAASAEPSPFMQDLMKAVEIIKSTQSVIVDRLTTIDKMTEQAAAPMPTAPASAPKVNGETSTIYFPLAVSRGPKIDAQLTDLMPKFKQMAADASCTANVLGFSDTLGNDDVNLRLSQKRADYVAAKLKGAGIRVGTVKGWGERWLKVHTYDGADNENNRRVVIDMNCGVPTA